MWRVFCQHGNRFTQVDDMFNLLVRSFSTKAFKSHGMVRILNVAEKNDAAKSLADIMSGGRYRKVRMIGGDIRCMPCPCHGQVPGDLGLSRSRPE